MSQKYVVYTFSLFLVTFSTIKGLTNVFSSYHLSDIDMRDRSSLTRRTIVSLSRTRVLRRQHTSPCPIGIVPTVSRPNRRPATQTVWRRGRGILLALWRAWHVSLTKGFRCVDLWKFFVPKDQNTWKPTKTGIALRLHEWPTFKQAAENLRRDNPSVANFTPCFLNVDHNTSANCPQCNPYPAGI